MIIVRIRKRATDLALVEEISYFDLAHQLWVQRILGFWVQKSSVFYMLHTSTLFLKQTALNSFIRGHRVNADMLTYVRALLGDTYTHTAAVCLTPPPQPLLCVRLSSCSEMLSLLCGITEMKAGPRELTRRANPKEVYRYSLYQKYLCHFVETLRFKVCVFA